MKGKQPGSSAPSSTPETQVWIDVATHNQAGMPDMGAMMGGMGGLAAKMVGGAQGTIGYPDARRPMMTGKFFQEPDADVVSQLSTE